MSTKKVLKLEINTELLKKYSNKKFIIIWRYRSQIMDLKPDERENYMKI